MKLTPVEYKLLALLVKNRDRIVSYDRIMDEVWGKGYSGETENIRICIRRLRKKITG